MQNTINLILEQNPKIRNVLNNNIEFIKSSIQKFNDLGLSYIDNDYYVYQGKGGLKCHETPKGVKKRIAQIAHKYDLSVVVTDGVFYQGDEISVTSDGTIETINIKKNSQSLIMGGDILAPYAIVSVFKDDVMITRKLFIVPNNEYKTIKAMGSGNNFHTMMALKMVYKRVLNGIFSLLGVTLDRADIKELDRMAEDMRVDDEVTEAKEPVDTIAEMQKIKDTLDVLDAGAVQEAKKQIGALYSQEVDADKKETLKAYGLELKRILGELPNEDN